MARRTPKQTLPVNSVYGVIPKDHPTAAAFREVPHLGTGALLSAFLPAIAITSLVILAFVWLCLHPTHPIPSDLLPLVVGAFFVWLAMIGGGIYLGLTSQKKRVQVLDQSHLGPPKKGEIRVGIAYAEGVWNLREDTAWDRGYLSASPEGLRFRGHCSEFALPVHAVRSVRLETSRMAQHRSVPRLFVDWTSPDGEELTLSLDTRPVFPGQAAVSAVERLRDEIQDALSRPSGTALSPIWPPSVRLNRLDLRGSQIRFTTRDFLSVIPLAVGFGVLVLAAITVLIAVLPIGESQRESFQRLFGYVAPQIPTLCGLVLLARKFQKKFKALPDPNQTGHDPLPQSGQVAEIPAETLKHRS